MWPSGLRRYIKAVVRKGEGSNPSVVIFFGWTRKTKKFNLRVGSQLYFTQTTWPSGLRRQIQVLFRKGEGSNPSVVIFGKRLKEVQGICGGVFRKKKFWGFGKIRRMPAFGSLYKVDLRIEFLSFDDRNCIWVIKKENLSVIFQGYF